MIEREVSDKEPVNPSVSLHRKEHLFADLAALQPVWRKSIVAKNKNSKPIPANTWLLPTSSVIRTPRKCYLVNKLEGSIRIYEVFPEPTCYEFTFVNEPTAISIINDYVYFLVDSNSMVSASLMDHQQPTCVPIPAIDQPYAMYAGYGSNSQNSYEEGLVVKILHWRKGLEIFELHQEAGSWLNNIFKFISGAAPYSRVVVLQPDVLACVVSSTSIKLVNLSSRNLIESEYNIQFKEADSSKVQVVWTSRLSFLDCKNSETVILMAYFVKNTNTVKLFKVTIQLQVKLDQQARVYLDQFIGHALLADRCSIQPVCEMYCQGNILSVELLEQGIFILQKLSELKTHCQLRTWDDITLAQPLEVMEMQLDKLLSEDQQIEDQRILKNRIVMPFRFAPSLISSSIYKDLSDRQVHELRSYSYELTTDFKKNLEPIQILEFQSHLLVVRAMAVTILLNTSQQEKDWFDLYYKSIEGAEKRPFYSHSRRTDSRVEPPPYLSANIPGSAGITDEQIKLVRVHPVPHLVRKYRAALLALRGAIQTPHRTYVMDLIEKQTICAKSVFISQLYSRIRAIGDILVELYPYSDEDLSYNDKKAIQGIQHIRQLLDQALPLYARSDMAMNQKDILSNFLSRPQFVFRLDCIESWPTQSDTALQTIFYGLINLQSAPNTTSFVRVSHLTEFICRLHPYISDYTAILASGNCIPTTPSILKCCVLSDRFNTFRDRIFNLSTSILETNMKQLKSMFAGSSNKEEGKLFTKALAILEASQLYQEPAPTTTNLQAIIPPSKECRDILRFAEGVQSDQVIEKEVLSKLSYLIDKVRGTNDDLLKAVNECVSRADTRLSQIIGLYRVIDDPRRQYILHREIFKMQCELFYHVSTKSFSSEKDLPSLADFIRDIRINLEQSASKLAELDGISLSDAEAIVIKSVELRPQQIKLNIPYLDVLAAAQSFSKKFELVSPHHILQYAVREALESNTERDRNWKLQTIVKVFPKSTVATETFRALKSSEHSSRSMSNTQLAQQTRKLKQVLGMINGLRNLERECS